MIGLLRTLAIILIIYYAFRLIGRYVLPLFFRKVVSNAEKRYRERQDRYTEPEQGKVGETVIDKRPAPSKKAGKDMGEYVDYEEVND
jgi:hypothetical protein